MSRVDFSAGRQNQKLRTRQALLEAARQLVQDGRSPTLAQVAERARVSRATAYRYFPSAEAMLLEAPLDARTLSAEELLPDESGSPSDRAVRVMHYFFDQARENEAAFRAYLRAVMDEWQRSGGQPDEPLRGGRRRPMLERALGPRRKGVPALERERLVTALAMLTGIEALLVTRDVCGTDPDRAREAIDWAARVLVRSAQRAAARL